MVWGRDKKNKTRHESLKLKLKPRADVDFYATKDKIETEVTFDGLLHDAAKEVAIKRKLRLENAKQRENA